MKEQLDLQVARCYSTKLDDYENPQKNCQFISQNSNWNNLSNVENKIYQQLTKEEILDQTKDEFIAEESKSHKSNLKACGIQKSIQKIFQKQSSSSPNINLNSIYKKIFKMTRTQNEKKKILERDAYEKEQQSKYRLDYGCISTRRLLPTKRERGAYYLCGGVAIETIKDKDNCQGSVLNEFISVLGAEVFEERGLVEVKLQNAQKGLTEFTFLSNLLQSQNQNLLLSQEIDEYYQFVQNLLRKKSACEQVAGFEKFSEIVSNKADEFDQFFKETVNKLKNQGQKIFTYRIYKFDLFEFEFKLKSHGYSEDFVKTLGYSSLHQFRDLLLHRGLPEIFTQSTRQRISRAHMAQIAQKKRTESDIPCTLLSLDGIEVDTTLNMKLIPFYDSNTPIYNQLFDCSAMLEISTYNITNSTLREVINMRRQINFDFNDALKQDIYYELQSQLFVDKFYSHLPLKVKKQMSVNSTPSNSQKYLSAKLNFQDQNLIKQNYQDEIDSRKLSSQLLNSEATSFHLDEETSPFPLLERSSSSNSTHTLKFATKTCGYRKIL